MKVFISWSGDRSKALAEAIKTWLADVIHSIKPWLSDHDIQAGARWSADLDQELQDTHFGVLCLTRENMEKPWLLFEAGSLAKSLDLARVVPYRLDVSATEVKPPLSQFQGVDATKDGTFKLLQSINNNLAEPLRFDRLERMFKKFWPDLETQITKIRGIDSGENTPARSEIDYLTEILELVRQLTRQAPSSPEHDLKSVLSILREILEKTNIQIRTMDAYEKHGGGGADTQSFIDHYNRAERQRAALKDALQRLEEVS